MIGGLTFALLGACTNDSPTEIPGDVLAPSAAVVSADNVDDLRITAATDSTITLTWTQVHNGANKPANYRVKYAQPAINWSTATIGCTPTMLGTKVGAPMSCTVQGLAAATTYDFQLMSFRIVSGGAWAGAVYSNVATGATTATTSAGASGVDDLSLAGATTSTLTVRWTQVDDGTGHPASYRVKHAAPPIAWSTALVACDVAGTQIGAEASCTITGLPASTARDVQLMSYRMVDGVWQGALASNVATGVTGTADASPVADLSVTAVTDSSLTVRWTQVSDGTGSPASYSVKYARPSLVWSTASVGCSPAPAATQVGAALSCTVSGLAASTGYEVQVMSYRGTSGAPQGAAYSNVAAGQTAATSTTPVASSTSGIWISPAEIAQLPTSGSAWNNLLSEANGSCGVVNLTDQEQTNNVCIMAKALVFARTGTASYRTDVVAALTQVVNSGTYTGRALALGRELGAYVIAADLINLKSHNAVLDGLFRTKLRALLTAPTTEAGSLQQCHERRPNNWGTHCGGSRAAIAAYLGDTAELARVATVFRGWLGDRSAYAGFSYGDLSWQCDSARPVGINAAGCTKNGYPIGGVVPDDQRRAGGFTWPAPRENYVWEALQGALLQAVILHRAGYPVWDWQNRALLRAVTWLHDVNGYPVEGDDQWQTHIVNHYYGTNFPAPVPARAGKNVGWTDWTH